MFKNFLAGLLLTVFVLLALPLTFLFGLSHTFLDEAFYKGDFSTASYDFFIAETPTLINLKEFVDLSEADFRSILMEVVTKNDFDAFVASTFQNLNEKIHSIKSNSLEVEIPLNLFRSKEDLFVKKVADLLYKKLPACDKNALHSTPLTCIPAGLPILDFQSLLRVNFDSNVFAKIPNNLAFSVAVPEGITGDIVTLFENIFTWILILGFVFLFFILLVIAWAVRKPKIAILRWEAKAIFMASFAIFLFLLLMNFVPDIFSNLAKSGNLGNVELIHNLLKLFLGSFVASLYYYVIPVLILSFILWILAIVYSHVLHKPVESV